MMVSMERRGGAMLSSMLFFAALLGRGAHADPAAGQVALRGGTSSVRKLSGSCDSACEMMNAISKTEDQVVSTLGMTLDFLLIAVSTDAAKKTQLETEMTAKISAFDSAITSLIDGNSAADIAEPPPQVEADLTTLKNGLWASFKALLADKADEVNSTFAAQPILVDVEAHSDGIIAALEEIVDKYYGDANLNGVPEPPQAQLYAKKQLTYISRMMKEALFIGLNYRQVYYMDQLLITQRLFQDAQTGLVYGNQVAGIPELTKVCTIHEMLNVDLYWGNFQDYLKSIKENQVFATLDLDAHKGFIASEAAEPLLVTAYSAFRNAWNSYADTDAKRMRGLQDAYIFNNPHPFGSKDILDVAMGSEAYHNVHQQYHPPYRTTLYARNYYDIFFLDLDGNCIYSVYKELDYATNFEPAGTGEWKDSGLGEAYVAAKANPTEVNVIDWKPYGPSANALASFLSTGIMQNGNLIGVFVTQMPPESKPELASAELLYEVEAARASLSAAMDDALGLFRNDDGSCSVASQFNNAGWAALLTETATQRKLAQKTSRIYFQFASQIDAAQAKMDLRQLLLEGTASLRKCMKGSYSDGIPAPPTQAIVDQMGQVWEEWQLISELIEMSYQTDDRASHTLAQIQSLSSSLFDTMSIIGEDLVYQSLVGNANRRSVVREIAMRQLTLLEKMSKEAFLVTLADAEEESEIAARVSTFENTRDAFLASHRDLLLGHAAESVSVAADASTSYVLEHVLFKDKELARTTDACTLTAMVTVSSNFEYMDRILQQIAGNGTAASAILLHQVNGLVYGVSAPMEYAVGFYNAGSGTCPIELGETQWEVLLDEAAKISYLFQKAQTEYYLLASGKSQKWMREADEALVAHQGYILENARDPLLAEAFAAFKAGWNSFRPTDSERRLGLQVAYITLNEYPAGSKDQLDYAQGSEEYHAVHKEYHHQYRTILYDKNYYDIFMLDMTGNCIYSVYKELDYATNFAADGDGEWKDSGLGEAFEEAMANPTGINIIDWKPYGPSYGALASFLSTGVYDAANVLIGVYVTQMPPESKPIDSAAILSDTVTELQTLFDDAKFGNDAKNIRPPPSQTIANRLFAVYDLWNNAESIITSVEKNSDTATDLAAQDDEFMRRASQLVAAVVEAAWAAAPQLQGTRTKIASEQLSLVQGMCRDTTLLSMGVRGGSRAKLREKIDTFNSNAALLTDGGVASRRLAGMNDVAPNTDPDGIRLMDAVMSSWGTLSAELELVQGGAQVDESMLRGIVEGTADTVDSVQASFELYAESTRTTTMLTLEILAPMPFTGSWAAGRTMRVASMLAESLINTDQMVLPGYKLRTVFFDDKCDSTMSSQVVLREMSAKDTYVALGGAGCSSVCAATAFVAKTINLPFLSYECPAASLSDTVGYPDLTRFGTITTPAWDVIDNVAEQFGWTHVSIVSGDPSLYREAAEDAEVAFTERGLTSEYLYAYETDFDGIVEMMSGIKEASKGKSRVIYLVGTEHYLRKVLCASIVAGNRAGITWLTVGTWRAEWWSKTDALTTFHRNWLREDVAGSALKQMFRAFSAAWDAWGGPELTDEERREQLQELYMTDKKEMFEGFDDLEPAYHPAHKAWHPMYRQILIDRDYYDIFVFDLRGNLIYSVYKESDYATNFEADGPGKWKDSGLGDAYRQAKADPNNVTYIDWKPYGPSGYADAAFFSIGINDEEGNLMGVYCIQLPPSYEVSIEEQKEECTLEAIAESYEGAINVAGLGRPLDVDREKELDCFNGHSSSSFLSLLDEHLREGFPKGDMTTVVDDPYNDVRAHAADATCVIAFAIREMLSRGYDIKAIQKPDQALYTEIVDYIKTRDGFRGASGWVKFEGNDKPSNLVIQQVHEGMTTEIGLVKYDRDNEIDWTLQGGPRNASWTEEFVDPPVPEAYFPWFIFQIIAPISIICVPLVAGAMRFHRA